MSLACADLPPLLAARPLGVLDASEESAVAQHLAQCADCRELEKATLASLVTATPGRHEPSPGVWARLEARIAADRAALAADAKPRSEPEPAAAEEPVPGSPPRLAPRIALGCTFCHAEVLRREAVFCGSCLAPHHESCFLQHGRCSAPGCTETRTVRPRETQVRAPARPSVLRGPLVAIFLATGVAALTLTAVGLDELRRQASLAPAPAVRASASPGPAPAASPSPAPAASPEAPADAPGRGRWIDASTWTGTDPLSAEVRAARAAVAEGRLSDAEDHLRAAAARGWNAAHEVYGNEWPELEPLRRRPGFFRRVSLAAPAIPDDVPRRDPFATPARKEGAK